MLGIPVMESSLLVGDNMSVMCSTPLYLVPHSRRNIWDVPTIA